MLRATLFSCLVGILTGCDAKDPDTADSVDSVTENADTSPADNTSPADSCLLLVAPHLGEETREITREYCETKQATELEDLDNTGDEYAMLADRQGNIDTIYVHADSNADGLLLAYVSHQDLAMITAIGGISEPNECVSGLAVFRGGPGESDACFLETDDLSLVDTGTDALEACTENDNAEAAAAIEDLNYHAPAQHELAWIDDDAMAVMRASGHGLIVNRVPACTGGVPTFFQAIGNVSPHFQITQSALTCERVSYVYHPDYCVNGALTLRSVAGSANNFGAVGAPDVIENKAILGLGGTWPTIGEVTGYNQYWHCDNGDSRSDADASYPQTMDAAWQRLYHCQTHIEDMRENAVTMAIAILDGNNEIHPSSDEDCGAYTPTSTTPEPTAKCASWFALGFLMHAVEDFYSHSNYIDSISPTDEDPINNPAGLGLSAPFDLFRTPSATRPAGYTDLKSGCYNTGTLGETLSSVDEDEHDVPESCTTVSRIQHDAIAKDESNTGRGLQRWYTEDTESEFYGSTNYQRAFDNAVLEVEWQWQYFIEDLYAAETNGPRENHAKNVATILCAMTSDNPTSACKNVEEESSRRVADYGRCYSDDECYNGQCARDNDNTYYVCCPDGNYIQEWGYFYCMDIVNDWYCTCNAQCATGYCDGPADYGSGTCKAMGSSIGSCPSGWGCSSYSNGTTCDWDGTPLVCRRGRWTYQNDCS